MRRLLAVVVAVALIGGAYVYRTRGDDGGGGGIGRSRSEGPLTLVCTTELAQICEAAEDANARVRARVEPAWTTFDAQADATDIDFDVWLAAGPWPQMLDERRDRTQRQSIFNNTVSLASAPLAVVIYRDDLAGLPCPQEVTWACLGEAASANRVRVGSPDPTREAAGIAVVAAATGGALDNPEFASNDLGTAEEAFVTSLGRQLGANGSTNLETMLATPAFIDARVDIAPAIEPVVTAAATKDRVIVTRPSPIATLVVTAGAVGADRGHDLLTILRGASVAEALTAAGWQVGSPPDAESDGLPSPGVLEALRELLA